MRRNFSKYWLPVLVYGVVILVLASLPQRGRAIQTWSWLLHLLEYTVFGFLLARAFKQPQINKKITKLNFYFWVMAAGVAYALLDELYQHFLPYRMGQISDVFFDSLGVVLGMVGLVIFQK